jgi:hypothetical protein
MSQTDPALADPAIAARLAAYDATHDVASLQDATDAAAHDDGETLADPAAALERGRVRIANWIAILSRFRRDIDPGFDPDNPPSARISPPGEMGDQYPPGIDPAAVKDPEMRRQYVIEIEKNQRRVALYLTALKLTEIHETTRERAAASLRDARQTLGVPSATIMSVLAAADITAADRAALQAAAGD